MNFKPALLAFILAAVALPLAHSQAKPATSAPVVAPAPATVEKLPTLEQWQDSQIADAVKDFQLANAAVTQAQNNVETARQKMLQVVNSVGVARHLDPTKTQFNFQTLKFETHPTAVPTPPHQNLKDKK